MMKSEKYLENFWCRVLVLEDVVIFFQNHTDLKGKLEEANHILLFSHSVMSNSFLWPHGLQYSGLPSHSLSPRACSNSCPSSRWSHSTISSSAISFSSYLLSFPASGSFPMTLLFTSSGQISGASALVPVLPMNIQGWFPLGLTGFISLQSKGLSRVFSSTTEIWKHQFLGTQPYLWSNSQICTWLLENTIALTIWIFVDKMLFFFNFSFFPPSFFPLISFFLFSSIIFYTMFHSQGNGASLFFFLIPSTSSEVSQVWHECLGGILQAHVPNPVVVTMPTKWSGRLV